MKRLGLHRSGGQAQWDTLAASRWNAWQRLAAQTHGVITPGNILTVSGFALTTAGLVAVTKEHYWLGLGGIGIGRLFDVADGWAAERTGTKSPLGESLDAVCDKLATALAVLALLVTGIIPWWVLLIVLLPHLAISAIAAVWLAHGQHLHPSRRGKLSMALAWAGLGGLVLATALHQQSTQLLGSISYALLAASVVLGIGAIIGYRNTKHPWQ